MTLVEAMTQSLPSSGEVTGVRLVPKSLPAPIQEVARDCLRLEPEQRCTIRDIRDRLHGDGSGTIAAGDAAGEEAAAVAEERIPVASRWIDEAEFDEASPVLNFRTGIEDTYLTKRPRWPIALGVMGLLALAAVLMARGDNYRRILPLLTQIARAVSPAKPQPQSAPAPAPAPASNSSAAASSPTAPGGVQSPGALPQAASPDEAQGSAAGGHGEPKPEPPVAATGAAAEPSATSDGAPSNVVSQAASPNEAQGAPAAGRSATEAESPRPNLARDVNAGGDVASRVLPHASQYAISSMRTPVEVVLRVTVDRSGKVASADYVSPGPGNYFARVSQQAAKLWRFKPPIQDGGPEQSAWMLQFYFSRSEVKASAVEMGR
jgi:TonB family protein